MSRKEWAKLEEEFITGIKPLTEEEKEIYKHIDYIEEQIRLIEIRRQRLLRVWKAISVKLMKV